jgi:hydrogenase expression/formation protein HypE
MSKELGKINGNDFENIIFNNCGYNRSEVSVGPQFGVDVSVIDLPNGLAIAATSDPLSLIPSLGLQESAWLSVQLMANDMATTGFAPMYAQFVLNLPATFSTLEFNQYWQHIHSFAKEIGVAITGGHTGFIEGQNSTIAGGGTFFTIAPKNEILASKKATVGNSILVTKQCAMSCTAILSMCFPETINNKLGKEVYDEACSFFYKTTSLKDALTATANNRNEITAMHDVTEGGVLGAIYEMATASGNGAIIYNDKLPVGNIQKEVCNLFSIDPRRSIGAGSMIIACKKGSEENVIERLKKENIDCTVVGEMVSKEDGIKITDGDKIEELTYLKEDPYWAAFFNAYKLGWK